MVQPFRCIEDFQKDDTKLYRGQIYCGQIMYDLFGPRTFRDGAMPEFPGEHWLLIFLPAEEHRDPRWMDVNLNYFAPIIDMPQEVKAGWVDDDAKT